VQFLYHVNGGGARWGGPEPLQYALLTSETPTVVYGANKEASTRLAEPLYSLLGRSFTLIYEIFVGLVLPLVINSYYRPSVRCYAVREQAHYCPRRGIQ
jgi:hypothetical protein